MPAPSLGLLQQLGRLVSVMKYGLAFSAAIVLLPLSGIDGAPLHTVTGNLFVELSPPGVFWASLFLMAAAWSVMLTTGLVVNGVTQRWDPRAPAYRRFGALVAAPSGRIPAWAETLFAVPVTPPQLLYFAALAVPGLGVMVRHAARYRGGQVADETVMVASALAAVGGVLVAYAVLLLLCTPAALLDPSDPPVRDPIATRIWTALAGSTRLVAAVRWIRDGLSRWAARLRLGHLLDPATGLLYPAHFLAITEMALLLPLWAVSGYLFRPEGSGLPVAPVVHLWMSVLVFVWAFGALEFHLGRLRISPLVVVAAVVLLGYALLSIDHTYRVQVRPATDRLDPVAAAEAGRGDNLVVIASAGGGISAAVWTTLALERLIGDRPQLQQEIRLLSTISGGSVGGAYYVDGVLRGSSLRAIRTKSGTSSLGAVAYGLAFRDFPSLLTGGLYTMGLDRGQLLEREWARIAAGTVSGGVVRRGSVEAGQRPLASLRAKIREGVVPAVVFGTTVMESGRRLMITPIDFSPESAEPLAPAASPPVAATAVAARPKLRAMTLSEYLGPGEAELDLWTAARMSATFSFVSPAARPSVADEQPSRKTAGAEGRRLWHHLIDGGYYDNFGVTSALDWLTPVLVARAERTRPLAFRRVAIVELRAFHRDDPTQRPPAAGSIAALLGPIVGLGSIRAGAAAERDDIDVGRFVEVWNRWFAGQSGGSRVCLASFVLEPGDRQPSPPLSWQLSSVQTKQLAEAWRDRTAPLGRERQRLEEFLDHGCGDGRR
jgi:hypothetical protein